MPSVAKMRRVCKEAKRKNLPVLAKTSRLNRFLAKFSSSNVKAVVLTRAPENLGGNHNTSFEALFTLSVAGHTTCYFSGVFVCNVWLLIVWVNAVSCRITL